VARYTPAGKLDVYIEMPVLVPTMVAFGGPDMSTLYVTSGRLERFMNKPVAEASGSIFAIATKFQGVPETKFKAR
jgi:sugar lactone lactonase YvrE